jgi:hypothetical protein
VPKVKKARDIEYRCSISLRASERLQRTITLITIETTKPFANFRYELSVREEVEGRKLRFTILGLKTPQLDLPSSGPAQFVNEYENLTGKYHIEVKGLDRAVSECEVRITEKQVKLIKSPESSFIEFVVS